MLFLAAHNCILYSPLSQTDTTDWISGNQIETYASGSMVWDANNNIWKFQHVSGQPYNNNMYAAKWEFNTQLPSRRAIFTCVAEFLAYNVSDINQCYDYLPTRVGFGFWGTKDVITDSAQVFKPSGSVSVIQYQYRNGISVFSYTYSSGPTLPVATHLRIGTFHNTTQAPVQGPYGIRNLALLADPLTLDEINEYFSLI
ncbi:MAG: hypothetical protein K6A41_04350 [Bacteroidales bacterium]|nr:hypothetical protein [Bacteroidales bacterium]